MTTRAIRRLRRRSALAPNAIDAPPELKRSYLIWSRHVGRYRTWIERGRRGVKPLDERWVASFDDFYTDIGPAPAKHALRPVDPGRPISPDNHRWEPLPERDASANTRAGVAPRLIAARGTKRSIREWAEVLGMAEHRLRYRLWRGISIDDLLAQAESTSTSAAA